MDRVIFLEETILDILQEYVEQRGECDESSFYHTILDKEQKRYVLFHMGFQRGSFYHIPIFHVAIKNEKVWIYEDKSEESMSELLLEKGVDTSQLVLGYFSPSYREYTDFAVA